MHTGLFSKQVKVRKIVEIQRRIFISKCNPQTWHDGSYHNFDVFLYSWKLPCCVPNVSTSKRVTIKGSFCTHVLTWFSMSVWGIQDNFNWWWNKCVKKESKERLCAVLEARQGQFTAQLGSLRALRRQGTPPMPSGQTTPCSHVWQSQRTDGRACVTLPS